MTLADYLASPQARDDVRALLLKSTTPRSIDIAVADMPGTMSLWSAEAWTRISATAQTFLRPGCPQDVWCYFRPDGERYIVSDLGEGVRALRLRTGDLTQPAFEPRICWQYGDLLGADKITAADLPDAICRVMLASLRVAGVGR